MEISNSCFFINQAFLIIIDILGVLLGVWVFFTNRKKKENQLFLLLTLLLLFWINGGYFFNFSKDLVQATILGRLILGEVFLSLAALYIFLQYFPVEKSGTKKSSIELLITGLIFFSFTTFTKLVVKEVQFTNWGVNPIYQSWSAFFYYGLIFFLAFLILLNIYKNYSALNRKEKLKIQYFLIGLTIFISTNLVFNIFFPLVRNSIQYWQFGNYSAIIFLGFTAYAILKQNLFGIRVILTQILVAVIAILLFVQILDAKTTFEYAWKGALFLTFLIFGYLLIRSVMREIKLREELEKAYVELKKLDDAKSEFISIASHQLRTPLAAMKGYVSMILDESYGPISSQIKTKLQNVFQSNERLIKMVNDLLNVSRIESGRIELNIQETAIEEVITGVVEILKLQARNKKLDLLWKKPVKSLPKALIDPDKTREIILNIVDNAIKYTRKGSVEISAKAGQDSILVVISDTGEGMSGEEIAKMFKSFSRGAAGNQFFSEGMGLGLYIARQFTDIQKGKIWAKSEGKGKGSTFFVELPIK